MTYLKREMENHKLSVTDMLERLKRHSKRDIPVAARDQMPVIFSSLAEPLSLYDPVDRSIVGKTSGSRNELKRIIISRIVIFHFQVELLGITV